MTRKHRIYRSTLIGVFLVCLVVLSYLGYDYYNTPLETRFYHPYHKLLKPSGRLGLNLGIVGTILIFVGVFGYRARKNIKALSKLGTLKYWLEFHIFLCSIGPLFVLFHTSFKFGGLISIGVWSMLAVVASGIVGRFIYVQIPRSIQGKDLSIQEINAEINAQELALKNEIQYDDASIQDILNANVSDKKQRFTMKGYIQDWQQSNEKKRQIQAYINQLSLSKQAKSEIKKLAFHKISLQRKIANLSVMQKLFRYWHVIHLPFAIIMLLMVSIHIVVALLF